MLLAILTKIMSAQLNLDPLPAGECLNLPNKGFVDWNSFATCLTYSSFVG